MAMAEPGPPKSSHAHLKDAGKLASRIEPRAALQPPAVARTAPRNPKAPLPPRVLQADKAEVAPAPTSGIVDTIEPESVHRKVLTPAPKASAVAMPAGDLLEDDGPDREMPTVAVMPAGDPLEDDGPDREMPTVAVMPKDFQKAFEQLQRRSEASNAVVPPPPPASSAMAVDFESALAQLQRQRETGAPPPPPQPSTGRASNAPRPKMASIPSVKDLGKDLKPLAALAAPPSEPASGPTVPATKSITAPLSTSGLKPGSGAPLSPLRTPSPFAIVSGASLRLSMPEKTSPMAGAPLQPPPAADSSPLALPLPAPSKPVPPSPLSSRPPGARKFSPANPGEAYERAFRHWSSPSIVPIDDSSTGEPVTFQVYTAEDVATGRRPMRSMVVAPVKPKTSLGVKIGLGLLGGVIVLLTAAAVIAVSTEEPKRTTTASSASAENPPEAPSFSLEPIPSTITIGDPVDEIEDTTLSAPTATTKTTTPASTATATAKPKQKPAVTPAPPSSLKEVAPPPNPYGN